MTEGLVLHVLFGTMLGILFGVTVSRFDAFGIDSVRKGLWDGVLAGLITILLGCVPFAILVGVPLTTMIPFVTTPHLVWGLVMGRLMGYFLIDLNASWVCALFFGGFNMKMKMAMAKTSITKLTWKGVDGDMSS